MRSHHLRDLPEGLRELFLSSFPTLRASADDVEVLWLEQTDFPRLRKEDLETDHPIVVMSDRPWRISHLAGEDVIDPLEPIAIPARPPVAQAQVGARRHMGRWARRITLPVSVGLIAFALGLLFPARSSILDAMSADPAPLTRADVEELCRHWSGAAGEDDAVRYVSEVASSRPALLRLFQEHNPSPRVRAEAARLLRR